MLLLWLGFFSQILALFSFWSSRLYALLCWYFRQRTSHELSLPILYVGREPVVFRLVPSAGRSCPVFHNRSQRRRDVISLALLFALSSPWNGPLEPYLFSATIGLALRLNRLKLCPFFWFSAWAAHSAPSLVDICRASVLSVS